MIPPARIGYRWVENGRQLDAVGSFRPSYEVVRTGNEVVPLTPTRRPPFVRVPVAWRIPL